MKKIIMAAVVAAFAASPALAQTVRMGTEGAYPPYNFINDKNEVDGLNAMSVMSCASAPSWIVFGLSMTGTASSPT